MQNQQPSCLSKKRFQHRARRQKKSQKQALLSLWKSCLFFIASDAGLHFIFFIVLPVIHVAPPQLRFTAEKRRFQGENLFCPQEYSFIIDVIKPENFILSCAASIQVKK